MIKMKGLGRGLDALLSGGETNNANDSLQNLDVSLLQSGKYQPRTHMDVASLTELSDSIKAQGIMQPVLVRSIGQSRYEIIAGERRWRAAKMAGLKEIPVMIRDVPDDAALAMALIENIQRENLNPLEEATGIQRLINEFSMTHQAAAEAVGRSRSAVSNLLRLTQLAAPVQELLMQGKIDMGHARALLPLAQALQIQLAQQAAAKNLSVREIERMVAVLDKPATTTKAPSRDPDLLRLQEEVSSRLGAEVKIKPGKKGAGRIEIEYNSLDELDGIIGKLS